MWHPQRVEMAPWSPEGDAVLASYEEALAEQVRHCGLPLVGLADPAPAPAMLGETSGSEDGLEGLGLSYGEVDPDRSDGPLILVHTTRLDASTAPSTLRYLL